MAATVTATVTAAELLKMVPWKKVVENLPEIWRQATKATETAGKLLADMRKPGQKKESTADAILRLSGELEALAANQQQLADILTEASAGQQAIVSRVAQTRRILFVSIGIGCANLLLLGALLLTR